MKSTLVIHPDDKTTNFLSEIYAGKSDWTIINYDCSTSFLTRQIKNHDQIILMGHGIPSGLLGYGKLVITSKFVYLLRDPNKEYVYIWCNADMFVRSYRLPGLYTGMVISEIEEASWYGIKASQEEIDKSNKLFAKAFAKNVFTIDAVKKIKADYNFSKLNSSIVYFNNQRIYQR